MSKGTDNPWMQKRTIDVAFELADRNGFYLEEDRNYLGKVSIKAKPGSGVWANDTVVAVSSDFMAVVQFLRGFEQHELYAKMAALPKPRKKKNEAKR